MCACRARGTINSTRTSMCEVALSLNADRDSTSAPVRRRELVSGRKRTSLRRALPMFSDTRNRGPETEADIGADQRQFPAACRLLGPDAHHKSLKCRTLLKTLQKSTGQSNAWLGREDSNLRMAKSNPLPYRLATPQGARTIIGGGPCRNRRALAWMGEIRLSRRGRLAIRQAFPQRGRRFHAVCARRRIGV